MSQISFLGAYTLITSHCMWSAHSVSPTVGIQIETNKKCQYKMRTQTKKTPSTECALRNSIKIDPLIFVAKPSDCLAESHRNISKTNRIHSPFVCCFFSAECAVSTAFFLTFFSFFLTVLHSSALIMLEHVVSHLCYEISSHTLTFTLGTLAKHMRCV